MTIITEANETEETPVLFVVTKRHSWQGLLNCLLKYFWLLFKVETFAFLTFLF